MSVHSTPHPLVRIAPLWALTIFLGTGAYVLFGAQEPEPNTPATPVTADAANGPAIDPSVQPIAFSHAHHVTEVKVLHQREALVRR